MLSKLFSKFSQKESDKSKRQVNNKNVHTEKTKITSNRIGDLGASTSPQKNFSLFP